MLLPSSPKRFKKKSMGLLFCILIASILIKHQAAIAHLNKNETQWLERHSFLAKLSEFETVLLKRLPVNSSELRV